MLLQTGTVPSEGGTAPRHPPKPPSQCQAAVGWGDAGAAPGTLHPASGGTAATVSPPHPPQSGPAPESGRAALAAWLNPNRWDIASRRGGIFQTSRSPHTRLSRCMPCPPLAKVSGRQSFPKTSKARSPRCGCAAPQPGEGAEPAGSEAHIFPPPPAPARRRGCQEPAPGRRVPAGVRSGSLIQAWSGTITRAGLGGQQQGRGAKR